MLQPIDSKPSYPQTNPSGEGSLEAREAPANADPIWQAILDRLPNGVAVLDSASARTLWTNSAMDLLLREGTGTTQSRGRAPYEYLPGLEADEWEEILSQTRQPNVGSRTGKPRRLQFVHYASRNIAYWECALIPTDEGDQGRHLILTVQAVSDRVLNERVLASAGRAAEFARRRAEALMRLTQVVNASLTTPDLLQAITHQAASYFDSTHAAVLLLGPDGSTLSVGYAIGLAEAGNVDAPMLDLTNTLAGRAIAHRRSQVVAEISDPELLTLALDTGEPPRAMISSPIWQGGHDYGVVEVYFPEPREVTDNSQAMLSAFADQTAIALHKADLYEQLALQQRQLHSIVENAPVCILYFDMDGLALSANSTAAQRFSLEAAQMIGRPVQEFLGDVPPGLFARVRSGEPFHASHHVHTNSANQQIVCDLSLIPVKDSAGTVSGVLLLEFEVTELVHARQEADQARQSAENALAQVQSTQTQMVQMEKMRAIGELASGVAHDFNNALMAILGYTELAEESLDSPEELAEQLAVIRKAAEDASSTVKRLQQFAKQRVKSHGELVDVNGIVKDVVDLTKPRWRDAAHKEGRNYKVALDLKPVSSIIAEPSGLREVLVNLVHNSLNAMPDGGNLTLSTQQFGENQVEICVTDDGVGMTPEIAARIFDPFFTTRGVEGTGLGLAVSWTIIQRLSGVIELDTEPGKGTRFMLRFPAADGAAAPAAPRRIGPSVRGAGTRALVVDDEPFVASVVTTILTRHGYRVVAAHSGKAALECLEQEGDDPFGVVLTDHGMPGLTGLQLTAEIKRRRPSLPVLLLTGWGESILQTHITDVLPDAVLGKPINQTDLIDAIARAIAAEASK